MCAGRTVTTDMRLKVFRGMGRLEMMGADVLERRRKREAGGFYRTPVRFRSGTQKIYFGCARFPRDIFFGSRSGKVDVYPVCPDIQFENSESLTPLSKQV